MKVDEDDSSSQTSLELDLNPQQLASVRLDKPLLKLRLMPRRRRIIATAPGGGGTPPPTGGGTVTVPLPERRNGTGINQPIETGGGPPQPPNGCGWWRLGHYSQKEIEDYHNNRQVEEELHHLMVMVMVMVMVIVMVVEGVIDHLPQEEMAMMMEMVVEMIHRHLLIMDSQDTVEVRRDRWVYVVQGPPGPPGHPGQDGRDGHDGHAPTVAQRNDKCSRSSPCSIGHYRFRKFL